MSWSAVLRRILDGMVTSYLDNHGLQLQSLVLLWFALYRMTWLWPVYSVVVSKSFLSMIDILMPCKQEWVIQLLVKIYLRSCYVIHPWVMTRCWFLLKWVLMNYICYQELQVANSCWEYCPCLLSLWIHVSLIQFQCIRHMVVLFHLHILF